MKNHRRSFLVGVLSLGFASLILKKSHLILLNHAEIRSQLKEDQSGPEFSAYMIYNLFDKTVQEFYDSRSRWSDRKRVHSRLNEMFSTGQVRAVNIMVAKNYLIEQLVFTSKKKYEEHMAKPNSLKLVDVQAVLNAGYDVKSYTQLTKDDLIMHVGTSDFQVINGQSTDYHSLT